MAKVIGLNGSPRADWNSATLLKAALDAAGAKGAQTQLYNLADLGYSGCMSCFGCKLLDGPSFGRCALRDDLTPILNDLTDSDEEVSLIIATPIYFGDVTGMVRNLFERIWFPGLLYSKDGNIAYTKKVKVGIIYTMNVGDEKVYEKMISSHKQTFERFLGETVTMCAVNTLQFDDYSKYASTAFNEAAKKAYREEHFGEDVEKARQLGASLV